MPAPHSEAPTAQQERWATRVNEPRDGVDEAGSEAGHDAVAQLVFFVVDRPQDDLVDLGGGDPLFAGGEGDEGARVVAVGDADVALGVLL